MPILSAAPPALQGPYASTPPDPRLFRLAAHDAAHCQSTTDSTTLIAITLDDQDGGDA
jgi:hypothetical protein